MLITFLAQEFEQGVVKAGVGWDDSVAGWLELHGDDFIHVTEFLQARSSAGGSYVMCPYLSKSDWTSRSQTGLLQHEHLNRKAA